MRIHVSAPKSTLRYTTSLHMDMKGVLYSLNGICKWLLVGALKSRRLLCLQAVIDNNIFPTLIGIMDRYMQFKTRKEAAWAVLNATSGGTAQQTRSLFPSLID